MMKHYASHPCLDCKSSHCNSKVSKALRGRHGQVRAVGEMALEHLAAAKESQRALETSCFASTLKAEGKS